MGDNRNASFDSRRFGPVPLDDLIGQAFVTIWPLSHFGGLLKKPHPLVAV